MHLPIRLAFSPDSDDMFMFWPLLNGKIDLQGLTFSSERADTETLNARASEEDVDVLAISVARYPSIASRYLLLPHGMSVGRGYGPVVVAEDTCSIDDLAGKRIGIPGLRTTAYMVLRLFVPRFESVAIPIKPYHRVFDALRAHEIDAALLIHEGRLTYDKEGFTRILDIGEAWRELTRGLPLPLGANVIRRSLGPELIEKISKVCRTSIAWSLGHRDEVMNAILNEPREGLALDRATLDRYLDMYANADTLELPGDGRKALSELYRRAREAGVLERAVHVEFAP